MNVCFSLKQICFCRFSVQRQIQDPLQGLFFSLEKKPRNRYENDRGAYEDDHIGEHGEVDYPLGL